MTKKYAISNPDHLIYYLSGEGDVEKYNFTSMPYDLYYLYGYYAAMFGESDELVGGEPFPKELAPIPFTTSKGIVYIHTIFDLDDEGYYYDKPQGYCRENLFDGLNPEQAKLVREFVDDLHNNYIDNRNILALNAKLREEVYPELVGLERGAFVPDRSIIAKRFVHRLKVEGEDYQTYFNKVKKIITVNVRPGASPEEIAAETILAELGEDYPVKFVNGLPLKQFLLEHPGSWTYVSWKINSYREQYPDANFEKVKLSLEPYYAAQNYTPPSSINASKAELKRKAKFKGKAKIKGKSWEN